MADRRMLSNRVLNMGKFIALPAQAQILYLRLNMMADDEGFLDSALMACRITGTAEPQVQALEAAGFVIRFPEGPVVITHWHVHNKLRKDRKKETLYLAQLQQLQLDESGVYRLKEPDAPPAPPAEEAQENTVLALYQQMCPSLESCTGLRPEEESRAEELVRSRGTEYIKRLFRTAEQTPFLCGKGQRGWRAGLPWLLEPGNGEKVLAGKFDTWKPEIPKGATGHLGEAEMAAIRRALAEP